MHDDDVLDSDAEAPIGVVPGLCGKDFVSSCATKVAWWGVPFETVMPFFKGVSFNVGRMPIP